MAAARRRHQSANRGQTEPLPHRRPGFFTRKDVVVRHVPAASGQSPGQTGEVTSLLIPPPGSHGPPRQKEPFATPRFATDPAPRAIPVPDEDADASRDCLELPRPKALLRTIGWNIAESFGLPTGAYAITAALAGRNAGLW